MRILIMFDLPVVTAHERKEYTRFRKYLLKSGFFYVAGINLLSVNT